MTFSEPISKLFAEIAEERSFHKLEIFKAEEAWSKLDQTQREMFAAVLTLEGVTQLQRQDMDGHATLALAVRVSPDSIDVLYRIALAYAGLSNHVKYWVLASQYLEKVTTLSPRFAEAWFLRATLLVKLGEFHDESQYFVQADECFHAASTSSNDPNVIDGQFYWQWGHCFYSLGQHSEEAADFSIAINRYREAANRAMDLPEFWVDYGSAVMQFGVLTKRKEALLESVELFRKATDASPDHQNGWLLLACTYELLFSMDETDAMFTAAQEAFATVVNLDPKEVTAWVRWGTMLMSAGHRDRSCLRMSMDKFAIADRLDPENPYILERLVEAEMWLGSYTESLELLKSAEEKILRCVELAPDSANVWYLYGTLLHELGRYFQDESYDTRALEKFQTGLQTHPDHGMLWYGVATSTLAIGEITRDATLIQKGLEAFGRVYEIFGEGNAQFWNDWGVALMKLTEHSNDRHTLEAAVDKFERAIREQGGDVNIDNVDVEILYNYGCALDFLGDFCENEHYYKRSIQVLSKVVMLEPELTHARYNLALAWSHLGELTSDVDSFHKANELFLSIAHIDAEDELAWCDWGLTLMNLAELVGDPSRPDLSEKLFEQAENKLQHAVNLGNVQAFYHLACLYSLMGNYTASMHFIERAERASTLPTMEDLMHDEWLSGVRGTHQFRTFISTLMSRRRSN